MNEKERIQKIKDEIHDIYDKHGVNGFFGIVETQDVISTNVEVITKAISTMGIILDNNMGLIIVEKDNDNLRIEFLTDEKSQNAQAISVFVDTVNINKNMLKSMSAFVDGILNSLDGIDYKNIRGNSTELN